MAATMTATVNPVGVWGKGATGTTTITWDSGGVAARVYVLTSDGVNPPAETLFDGDPTKGSLKGSKALTVVVGSTYALTMRRVSNNATLASLTVTVIDELQEIVDRATADAALEARLDHPQQIYDLKIKAGVDFVVITFGTVQPTVAIVVATAPDGTIAASSFPVLNGLATDHVITLGTTIPLAQQTTFALTITATGTAYAGKPVTRVVKTEFTTGSRTAGVLLEQVQVLAGSGDFTFQFGAGDADADDDLGQPWPIYTDKFGDSDPPHWIRDQIQIPNAPRNLWIGATGEQTASFLWPGQGLPDFGSQPSYDGGPTGYESDSGVSMAWATRTYNIADGGTQTVDLLTGIYDVMFEVLGQVGAAATQGTAPTFPDFSTVFRQRVSAAALAGAGKKAMIAPQGGRRGLILARGADGSVYRQMPQAGRKQNQNEGWVALTPPVAGSVTAVAMHGDRLVLLALDAEGAVLRADAVGDRPAGAWVKLGGHCSGTITAVAMSHGIAVFAQDKAGGISHRALAAEGGASSGDWQRIGEAMPGQLTALALGEDGVAVFALDRKGAVMHRQHHKGEWRSEGWHTIPGAAGTQLGVAQSGAGIENWGIGLALIDESAKLHTLTWRPYPEGQPERWTAQGDLQAWLTRPSAAVPAKAAATAPQMSKVA